MNEDQKVMNPNERKSNLRKDRKSIALLLFLYFLQGLPLGITINIKQILLFNKEKKEIIILNFRINWCCALYFEFKKSFLCGPGHV